MIHDNSIDAYFSMGLKLPTRHTCIDESQEVFSVFRIFGSYLCNLCCGCKWAVPFDLGLSTHFNDGIDVGIDMNGRLTIGRQFRCSTPWLQFSAKYSKHR